MNMRTTLFLLSSMFASLIRAQALDADPEFTAIVNEAVARVADASAASNAAATNLVSRLGELRKNFRAAEAGNDRLLLREARAKLMSAQKDSLRSYRESLRDLLEKATEAVKILSAATAASKASPAEEDEARQRLQAVETALIGLSAIPATSSDASDAWAAIAEMANLEDGDDRLPTGRLLLLTKRVEARIARIDRALLRGDAAALSALLNDLDTSPDGGDFLSAYNSFCKEISGKTSPDTGTFLRKIRKHPPAGDSEIDIAKPF